MISIVLPVYNGEKYLRKALDSIIGQTYREWELIIVNDCSTDNTLSICEEYALKDNRIRILNNTKNLKLPKSLNRGFEDSKGEYLTWTSDDNMYEPKALEVLLQEIEKGYDMVYSNMIYIGERDEELSIQFPRISIWQGNNIGASFLYRRKIYDELGGYNEDMYLVEDYEYWIRVSKHYKVKYCDQKLYKYRRHEGSLTSAKVREVTKKRIELLEMQLVDSLVNEADKDQVRVQLINDYAYIGDDKKLRLTVKYLIRKELISMNELERDIRFKYFFGSNCYHLIRKVLHKE